MGKVRIGNDIQVKYTVLRDGLPESFVGATNIAVEVRNEAYGKVIPSTFSIVDNVVNVVLDAKDCVLCGKHRVTLSYNRGNDITIDALAFELVQFTSQTGGTEIVGVEIVTVNISGDIGIAIPDNNKIDLDGLNSNIDKLHFKPDTLVQLAEVGDVRYSTESKTLEVKVSDTVSIQLGQEMQTRVKNDADVQINNGQLVYIDSAAGANPLAKIASTTDANIAQRTFGMATENIAFNGFGAITTEGLVRDVNTAAFTEGDMLWLGVNGAVTNIEPVAPTPKISVGMVLMSNVANGVIYVKIRAISRNQKLSDVYAPTLTGGDILRWNSTTLRFETFNITNALAGKADLVGGKIPTSQLPSYVDDVLEYANLAAFPATGETGKIYVALDTNLTYRWSGTAYVEISKSLALGETSATAYRGDRGKGAYDHSQVTNSNPHGTTASQIPNTPAGTIAATNVQEAINELDGDVVQVRADLNILNNINTLYPAVPVYNRVIADTGLVRSKKTLNSLTQFLLDLRENTKLLFCPELGVKLRTSGVNNYVTKLYDISPMLNGGIQTTALNQPFLSGNIAPNDKYAIKNPNGGNTFLTHTPISFSAGEKWSVSIMLNFQGTQSNDSSILLKTINTSFLSVRRGGFNYIAYGDADGNRALTYIPINHIIGKNTLLTFSNNGINLVCYINGSHHFTFPSNLTSKITFDSLVGNLDGYRLYAYIKYHSIRDIALTPTQVAEEYTYLRNLFPEMESVQIGTQTWTTSNCEMTCTPQGYVIPEMQAATNVEIITNAADRDFSSDTGFWFKNGGNTRISSGNLNVTNSEVTAPGILRYSLLTLGKIYRLQYTIVSISNGGVRPLFGNAGIGTFRTSAGTYTEYATAAGDVNFRLYGNTLGQSFVIDNISIQEVGWSDSTNLYNAIYVQTSGTAEQKEYAAVKAAAMWRNVNNDPVLASVYGKKFNKYAKRLLAMDIAYYNAANPTALWGWDIPTQAQLTTLATNGGNALKVGGTDYWNTANGINSTGLTLLGGGYIDANGNYVGNKTHEGVWAKDADIARVALDADNSFNEVAATTEGYSIRLIKV